MRFVPDRPTDRLVFRLWPNGPAFSRTGIRLDVGGIKVDGAPASASHPDPTTLVLALGRALGPGQAVTASMAWRLMLPLGPTTDRISRSAASVRMGTFFPLLAWEPGVGWATEPPTTVHGETAASPAADFDLAVTAPAGQTVLATGVPDGRGHWRADAVPDIGLSVGRFRLAEGTADGGGPSPVALTVGVSEDERQPPGAYLAKMQRVLPTLGRRFGAYPWRALTFAITPGLPGGIEYPMHVMQGPGTLGRTTSHEIGHQWFYGLVTNDQARDPWLDEALASWAEAGFEGTLPQFRARIVPAAGRGRAGAPMTFWQPRPSAYYRSVYVQGTQALAALGPPDRVDCALHRYVDRTAYRIARPADLVASLRELFPGADAVLARYGIEG